MHPEMPMTSLTRRPRSSSRVRALQAAPLLVLGALSGCGGDGGGEKLNVLLITLDTTRPDRMTCYGGQPGLTPTIDTIASEGVRFDRAISTAGITPMSHSSILTGLNNYAHGMRVFYSPKVSHRLKEVVDTLPEVLKDRGYRTAGRVSAYPVSGAYGLDQGFDSFTVGIDVDALNLEGQQRHETFFDTDGLGNTQRRGDKTVDDAINWLDKNGNEDPWCMWVHMFDVHDYSLVPEDDFMERFAVGPYPEDARALRGATKLDWTVKMYDPELAFMDAQIARLRGWLEANGQLDNTVIVITADHAQGLREGYERHGWMRHRLLYDWCLRVPLIVRVPGFEPATGVVENQVRTIDVLPTIAEALGVPLRNDVEGLSLVPLMRGETESEPRIAYADALNVYDKHCPPAKALPPHQKDNMFMACDGRWKLIWHESNQAQSQLYDLLKDPKELQNLYRDDHPRVAPLKDWITARGANVVEPPGSDSKAPNVAALNALGYGGGEEREPDTEPDTKDKPK